jgi:hypothetical protein
MADIFHLPPGETVRQPLPALAQRYRSVHSCFQVDDQKSDGRLSAAERRSFNAGLRHAAEAVIEARSSGTADLHA